MSARLTFPEYDLGGSIMSFRSGGRDPMGATSWELGVVFRVLIRSAVAWKSQGCWKMKESGRW